MAIQDNINYTMNRQRRQQEQKEQEREKQRQQKEQEKELKENIKQLLQYNFDYILKNNGTSSVYDMNRGELKDLIIDNVIHKLDDTNYSYDYLYHEIDRVYQVELSKALSYFNKIEKYKPKEEEQEEQAQEEEQEEENKPNMAITITLGFFKLLWKVVVAVCIAFITLICAILNMAAKIK